MKRYYNSYSKKANQRVYRGAMITVQTNFANGRKEYEEYLSLLGRGMCSILDDAQRERLKELKKKFK